MRTTKNSVIASPSLHYIALAQLPAIPLRIILILSLRVHRQRNHSKRYHFIPSPAEVLLTRIASAKRIFRGAR